MISKCMVGSVTFIALGDHDIKAVRALCALYGARRRPDDLPIICLRTESYRYGSLKIHTPDFGVVGFAK